MTKTKPIKVLQISGATISGTRRHVVSIVKWIDKNKFHVEVAAPTTHQSATDDTVFVSEIEEAGVLFHPIILNRSINPIKDIKSLLLLTKLIKEGQYDVVHTHSSKAGFIGRIAAKLNGVPTIYTPNGFYFLGSGNSLLKNKLFLFLERLGGTLTNYLIAVSASEGETAVQNKVIHPKKLITIPNAIDIDEFAPDPDRGRKLRTQLGIDPDMLVVGTVARYIPQKDPLTFISTVKLVLEKMPNTCFIWCGEGEMRDETEAFARELGIASSIRFLGFRKDVHAVIKTFDIFALASVFEGLPYTLLEVMATALPVVATDVVGSRDIVVHGETGLLVAPKNPDALAKAIVTLLHNPEQRQKMGAKGHAIVRDGYNIKPMVRRIEGLYAKIACVDLY